MGVAYIVFAVSSASFLLAAYMERRNDHPARRFERVQFIASASVLVAVLGMLAVVFADLVTRRYDVSASSTPAMSMVWLVVVTWLLLADGFLILQRDKKR